MDVENEFKLHYSEGEMDDGGNSADKNLNESFELDVSAGEEAGDFNKKEVNVTFVISRKGGDGDKQGLSKGNTREETSKVSEKKQKTKAATQNRKTFTTTAPEDVDKLTCNEKVIVTNKTGGINQESKTSKITKQVPDLAREENFQEKRLRSRAVKGKNDNTLTSQVPLVTKPNYEDLKDPVKKKKNTIGKRVEKQTVPAKTKVSKRHISRIPVDNKGVNDDVEEPVQKRKRSKVGRVCMEVLSPRSMARFIHYQKPKETAPVKTLPASEKSKNVRVHFEHCTS